jgi:hypothetical protein
MRLLRALKAAFGWLKGHFLQKMKFFNLKSNTMKKETWKFIIQTVIAILTAIATTLGVTACMGAV